MLDTKTSCGTYTGKLHTNLWILSVLMHAHQLGSRASKLACRLYLFSMLPCSEGLDWRPNHVTTTLSSILLYQAARPGEIAEHIS